MGWLIGIGTCLSLAGVGGLFWCIALAMKARRAGLDDAAMRDRLQQVVIYNMAALGISALGLILVVAGIVTG